MGDTTADLPADSTVTPALDAGVAARASNNPADSASTDVVIVGAGPGGAALALLLARQGVGVALLERRTNFAREFRGEVLMPSGVDALEQMGVGAAVAQLPGALQSEMGLYLGGQEMFAGSIDPQQTPIRALSQPALLECLVAEAAKQPNFRFIRGAAVKELMRNAGGRITGVRYTLDGQAQQLRATLVVGADGRNSIVRRDIGVAHEETSPPMDIVWFKLPRPDGWQGLKAFAERGHLLVAYHSWGDKLQIGWV